MEDKEKSQLKLFLIDDSLDECAIFRDYFNGNSAVELCGFETDALEGIRKVRLFNPDVVVTDFIMPNIDGLEIVKNIKAFSQQIRVIVLSGISDTKIADRTLKQGADYYFVKPVMLSFLQDRIISVCKKDWSPNICMHNRATRSVNKFIQSLGVPVDLSGYDYIVSAVNIMVESNHGVMLKEINNMIAEKNMTSAQCIDACVHNAIIQAHRHQSLEYVELFGNIEKAPSNYTFLKTIKEAVICN